MSALPGEYGSFEVGHHGQMAAVGRSDTGYPVRRAVGICRISIVGVLGYDIVSFFGVRQLEFTFSVGNPYTEFRARYEPNMTELFSGIVNPMN